MCTSLLHVLFPV